MSQKLRLAVIYGSVREGRFCDTVASWVLSQLRQDSAFDLEVIDPRADWPSINELRLRRSLEAADAILVVVPEYNHSFPGPLKILIDSAKGEWAAKPVAFVSYGGTSGGLRAVEHLRAVFAELHALTVRETVSFANAWEQFTPDGKPADEARHAKALDTLLDRLEWWATALKAARGEQAYGVAA